MAIRARGQQPRNLFPFNPLDKMNLGVSVANAMLSCSPVQLPLQETFTGAGIYALYYGGDFPLYVGIAKHNLDGQFKCPIYVGKTVPPGSRKGGFGLGTNPGTALRNRIREHERSLQQCENLNVEDFYCRYLAVEDIWIPLGESLLIRQTLPLWNIELGGFGIHKPGGGRDVQALSDWDTIHPGRKLAEGLPKKADKSAIIKRIERFIANHPLNS